MDEALIKQLTRQLKILNIWITIVGVTILAAIIICLYLLFKVFTFVENTQNRISDLQEKTQSSLDVKEKICSSNSVGGFLDTRSELCNE